MKPSALRSFGRTDSRITPCLILSAVLCWLPLAGFSQITWTGIAIADSFLATGSPGNPSGNDLTNLNFGSAGALAIAPGTSLKGEFKALLKFNLSPATNLFNQAFGPNWIVTHISLELTGNNGDAGEQPNNPIFNVVSAGNFVIQWLADDSWTEGTGNVKTPTTDGVSYSSLPALLSSPAEILCTNTYSPPGDNVPVLWPLPLAPGLLSDATAGGDVSFLLSAADNQVGYVFNSWDYGRGNEPKIHVTAIPLLKITSAQFTNGVFHIAGVGAKNAQYHIHATGDLATNWQTLATVTADNLGQIKFDDTFASNQVRRFYRLAN
jgi:hypothetical protein